MNSPYQQQEGLIHPRRRVCSPRNCLISHIEVGLKGEFQLGVQLKVRTGFDAVLCVTGPWFQFTIIEANGTFSQAEDLKYHIWLPGRRPEVYHPPPPPAFLQLSSNFFQ